MPSQAALEPPSVGKAWRLVKTNASTWAVLWIFLWVCSSVWSITISPHFHLFSGEYSEDLHSVFVSSFISSYFSPIHIIYQLIAVHFTVVPAIFYATGEHPTIRILIKKFLVKPWRYFFAGLLFIFISILGLLLCVIPGIIVLLARPIYVNLIFNTNLGIIECLSKSIKSMFKNFIPYFFISLFLFLFTIIGFLLCFIPVLIIFPICEYYMQNFIYQKGYIS